MTISHRLTIHWLWRIVLPLLMLLRPTALLADEAPAAHSLTTDAVARYFDATLTEQMDEQHLAGATVAVVQEGELLFAKGYGYADVAAQTPVVADQTLFFPGSVGKLFTWTAVMQLVEQGKLDLAADINQYLDFAIPNTFAEPITLEHLMTHTAGFEEQLVALQAASADDLLPLREFLVEYQPERVYPPGQWFAYSNYGTALAGYIVERVSGQPFEQYITGQILEPLDMTRSAAVQPLPDELMVDYSQGYHYRNGEYEAVNFEWIPDPPAAPVRATATDMAHFMIAHLNNGRYGDGRILGAESVAAMHQTQFTHDPWVMGMGYGFMISQENGHSVSWHTGGSAHFSTLLALIPDQEVGFFISFNTPVADLRQPLTDFMNHFYPAPAAAPVQPPADTAERIAALTGTYIPARTDYSTPQKFIGWLGAITVQPGDNDTLLVGPHTYIEVEPGHFRQVDGPRNLAYATDENGTVRTLFRGPFAYFQVPWYQTLPVQVGLVVGCLLLFATAVLAWLGNALFRRRQEGTTMPAWAKVARGTAVVLGVLNMALLAWFVVSLLGYAETYVFPVATVALITQMWWLSIPLTAAVVVFAVLVWRRHVWQTVARVHYTLVVAASVLFLFFLANWNLIAL